MVIVDKRRSEGDCRFVSLANGDVFEHSGNYYCKLQEKWESKIGYNALDLSCFGLAYFNSSDIVTAVRGTLVIESMKRRYD